MSSGSRRLSLFLRKVHTMLPRVEQVRHLGEYRLELRFTDGTKGELDLKERVVGRGGVFEPLEDISFFKQVQVDPEPGTIVWPNDVDLCPDVLYSLVTGRPVRVLEPV
jgi:hypothetical protein